MSFRPFIKDVCCIGLAGFLGVICAGASHAADETAQSIEVVPARGASIDTNVVQSTETKGLNLFMPHAPQTLFNRPVNQGAIPMPPPQQPVATPSARDRELMDRRRNWVFMTPEEMMGTDVQIEPGKEADGENLTAMERYYQRLYDADRRAATNDVGKIDSSSWNRATNAFSVEGSSYNPFYSTTTPDPGVFQPSRPVFTPAFDTGSGTGMPTPEEVRLQAEQKAHMDSFKQLWDIDQPKAAVEATPLPVQASSTPVFGSPGDGQMFRPTIAPLGSRSGYSQSATPDSTVSATRAASRPPRADFSVPQRPF